jgi:methionyl-tRNA synthetase
LDISFDDFIQTSEPRHHTGCRKFIQAVYDNGHIYKGSYGGWYCDGCEAFKTEKELIDGALCPDHKRPVVRRDEPCYYFRLSAFRDWLLEFYEQNPEFIQPVSRRNEILSLVRDELLDVNITRRGETWGIRVPFDEEFTIYVWFDALLNYITAIGYGTDEAKFAKWWPADLHVIGKDITRFHCALWPAMLKAAGLPVPKRVFGHGFVYRRDDATGQAVKESKTLGNVTEPMDLITKFNGEAFRYYFLKECPFPSDGEYSMGRFALAYNSDLANNFGNLYSRVVTLVSKNYDCVLVGTGSATPEATDPDLRREAVVAEVRGHVEGLRYNQALDVIWRQVLDPANRFAERREPWKQVKTDKDAARASLFAMIDALRSAAILLKPFLPRSAETVYRSFNFAVPWEKVRYEDAAVALTQPEDLRVVAELEGGKVRPLFPRIA